MSGLFGPKVALARAAGAISRRSGRGGGTTLPGRLLLRLAPDALGRLSASLVDDAMNSLAAHGPVISTSSSKAIRNVTPLSSAG